MDNHTSAELANTLAIQKVRSDIRWLELLSAIPKYQDMLAVRRHWLFILLKRDERLGSRVK